MGEQNWRAEQERRTGAHNRSAERDRRMGEQNWRAELESRAGELSGELSGELGGELSGERSWRAE